MVKTVVTKSTIPSLSVLLGKILYDYGGRYSLIPFHMIISRSTWGDNVLNGNIDRMFSVSRILSIPHKVRIQTEP